MDERATTQTALKVLEELTVAGRRILGDQACGGLTKQKNKKLYKTLENRIKLLKLKATGNG